MKQILFICLLLAEQPTFAQAQPIAGQTAVLALCRCETQAHFAFDSKAFRDCRADVPEVIQLYYSTRDDKVDQLHMPQSRLHAL